MIQLWGSPPTGLPFGNHAQPRLGRKYAGFRRGGDRAHPRRRRQDHRRTRFSAADRRCRPGAGRHPPDRLPILPRNPGAVGGVRDAFGRRLPRSHGGPPRRRHRPRRGHHRGMAFAIEELASDNQVEFVLNQRHRGGQKVSIISDTALAFGRSMLHRYDIDWEHYGFDEAGLDELNEFSLRVLHSFLADPGRPPAAAPICGAISPAGSGRRSPTRSWSARWMRWAPPSRRERAGARRRRPDRDGRSRPRTGPAGAPAVR